MALSIREKVENSGLVLPDSPGVGGNYSPVIIRGNIGYVAIQFPIVNGSFHYQGKLGNEHSTDDGYLAMQMCALNVLAQMDKYISFDDLDGLNHVSAYYQSGDGWDESPQVVNGASDLFIKVLGEKGLHSRTLLGVHGLPKRFCVGLTVTFTKLAK